jgi:hypothetical protein
MFVFAFMPLASMTRHKPRLRRGNARHALKLHFIDVYKALSARRLPARYNEYPGGSVYPTGLAIALRLLTQTTFMWHTLTLTSARQVWSIVNRYCRVISAEHLERTSRCHGKGTRLDLKSHFTLPLRWFVGNILTRVSPWWSRPSSEFRFAHRLAKSQSSGRGLKEEETRPYSTAKVYVSCWE